MQHYVRRVTMTAGIVESRDLNNIPAQAPNGFPWGIRGILLHLRLVLVSASTSDAIAQGEFVRMLDTLMLYDVLGKPWVTEDNPVSGRVLRAILSYLRRVGYNDPTAIAADSNTTNTKDILVYIPLRLEEALEDDDLCVPAALELKGGRIDVGWCASTEFGTGQVITQASSYCDIYLDLIPLRKLEAAPRLVIGQKTPDSYDQWSFPLQGKPLVLAVVDPAAAGVAESNDFTHIEIRGQGIHMNRQVINGPGFDYNAAKALSGDGGDAAKPLADSGSAEDFPMWVASNRDSSAKLPTETAPVVTLVAGAGAPTTTEFRYGYAVIRAADQERFAEQIGATKEIALTAEAVRKAFAEDPVAKGRDEALIKQADAPHVFPFLRKPVNLKAAGYGKCC